MDWSEALDELVKADSGWLNAWPLDELVEANANWLQTVKPFFNRVYLRSKRFSPGSH